MTLFPRFRVRFDDGRRRQIGTAPSYPKAYAAATRDSHTFHGRTVVVEERRHGLFYKAVVRMRCAG